MKLSRLLQTDLLYKLEHDGDPDILSIEMDSRKVRPGSLFVCVRGERFDGHEYAQEAVDKGAVALVAEHSLNVSVPVVIVKDVRRTLSILSDRFYDYPTHKMSLIGVTGTNGKTTVTHLIKEIQDKAGRMTGIIGTLGIGYMDVREDVGNTTPEAPVLQRAFRDMIEHQVTYAVMEVSSHALVQGRVRGCDYNIAVFTNLTQDHLDYHKTMEEYLHAKSLLFSQLGNTYDTGRFKAAIINNDDSAAGKLKEATAAPVWTYGIDQEADFMAKNIRITPTGTIFRLCTPDADRDVHMRLIGKFNVYNVLAATAACLLNGIAMEDIVKAVEQIQGVSGRFETVDAGQDFTVIVDYSHTPDSLANALQAIREFAEKRVITVVGCGGDRDRTKRPIMAKTAVEHSDVAIFTSDNPRTEDPEAILEDMEKGVTDQSYIQITDRRHAITAAINEAQPGDIVLIAGKGHETYQIIGHNVIDFDDRLVAKEAIKERLHHGDQC
ncbi:MAG: UDP-N-acetylmuramoyl-L-alanyl-D-glutamate--2,6-diaminopimelate ligase [Tuberibacillus sp.]